MPFQPIPQTPARAYPDEWFTDYARNHYAMMSLTDYLALRSQNMPLDVISFAH